MGREGGSEPVEAGHVRACFLATSWPGYHGLQETVMPHPVYLGV